MTVLTIVKQSVRKPVFELQTCLEKMENITKFGKLSRADTLKSGGL